MPQTPRVRFNFKNLNVQSSVPLLGVINVVARTTKGPFEDPKDLIATPSQFTRIFGSEIVMEITEEPSGTDTEGTAREEAGVTDIGFAQP